MPLPLLSWLRQSLSRYESVRLYVFIGWLLSAFSALAADPIRLEAEATQGVALNGVYIARDQSGYSGSGYAWGFDDDSNGGDNMVFTFPATAGAYELTIGYYSPYGDKKSRLTVNGATSEQDLKNTGANFGAVTVGKFQLTDGQNTVIINKNWGYYGIDYIVLTPATVQPPTVVPLVNGRAEAELGNRTGVDVASINAGFSGTGYVTGFDNATDQLTLTFNATAGLYDLNLGYASPYGDKGVDVSVNNDRGSGTLPQTNGGFRSVGLGKFLLNNGLNTVTIYRGWGYFDIDYIQLTASTAPLPAKPPKTLVDTKATPSTLGLFSYLVDQYGSKVLSGQQDDVEYIQEKTGKEPAIGSFDLIDYSPSRVQYGATPARTSEAIIDWAKKGNGRGIISLMWHWNAPTDLINQAPDKLWWRGFYTDATTFDLAAALTDKNGERYQLMLRDIDAIAVQLKKFQAADVPVLWRPLHEAPGGWFWWGAKGSGPFRELWRLLYDRLTNYHQLHNLIWVYTATDTFNADWYPGDQYVDVVGLDIYADSTANMSGNWASAQASFNGKKLVTLSETGNLPNPDKIRGFGTWWSWFSVWTGTDYIKKQSVELLNKVYHDDVIITRDELPDWRPAAPANLLKMKYQDGDNEQTSDSKIRPRLLLTNEGATAVPYSELTIRYWLTAENFSPLTNLQLNWAPLGTDRIRLTYVPLPADQPRQGAFGYVEYSFANEAGQLAANSNTPIFTQFAKKDWSAFNELDDYSYKATGSSYETNDHVTIYRNGALVWGVEPAVVATSQVMKVYSENRNGSAPTSTLNTYLQISNEGNVPVVYKDLKVRYWFTAEGTQALRFYLDWAKLLGNAINGQFVKVARSGADTYLELSFNESLGTLSPLSNTGNIQYRIAKGDWSAFDPTNDYSFAPAAPMSLNEHVTVYYRNQLVFGTEPAPTAARLTTGELTPLVVTVLGNPVVGSQAKVEIRGAEGSRLRLLLTDEKGRQLAGRAIEQASQIEQHVFALDGPTGVYLLQVNTPTDAVSVKLVKP